MEDALKALCDGDEELIAMVEGCGEALEESEMISGVKEEVDMRIEALMLFKNRIDAIRK